MGQLCDEGEKLKPARNNYGSPYVENFSALLSRRVELERELKELNERIARHESLAPLFDHTGVVTSFNARAGFGYIVPHGSNTAIRAHFSQVLAKPGQPPLTLVMGQRVRFQIAVCRIGGPHATHIEVIE